MGDEKQTDAKPSEDTEMPEHPTGQSDVQSPSRHHWPVIITILLVAVLGMLGVVIFRSHHTNTQHNTTQASSDGIGTKPSQSAKTTNTWQTVVDPAAIPLGDGKVSTTPKAGYIDSCTTSFRGGGAEHSGDWLDTARGIWNSETKVAVQGAVAWPNASYSIKISDSNRIITTNDLPENNTTGIFPIALSDPAHQYDANPNSIGVQNLTYNLPLNPTAASTPACTSLGAIGVLSNGTLLYNGLDAAGRDAVAHETQDSCNGHPDGGDHYHYHDIPSCILNSATGSATLVGYALDGYGIYVERDGAGNLPTNADLDECHGRTSEVTWNDSTSTIYHYDATLEYPFTIGCFHGTPIASQLGPRNR